MNEKSSWVVRYLSNPRLVILALVLILILGISSFLSLPRDLNPEIKIPIVIVSTILPGGSPQDVESLVTIPIEDSIQGLEKVKQVTSTSRDSVSTVTVEFNSGVDPEKARTDVKGAVDTVNNLPKDATTPKVIKLDFANAPVWTFALTTNSDTGSLFRKAKDLQTKLKDLAEVSDVAVGGLDQTEVEITINPQVIASYGISPIQISGLISTSLKAFPAGIVKTSNSSFSLSIDPLVTKVSDIRTLRVNLNGANVSLGEIAVISEHPKPDQNPSFATSPEGKINRAVTFSIFKTSSANIDKAVKSSEKLLNSELSSKDQFSIHTLLNTSSEIDRQFGELQRDFVITITLVALVLFIFLGLRQALVSALSAPLAFLITFIVMRLTGISLNFLSLFSLLLALGLLVDDTVVIISAMSSYYRRGKLTPLQTGTLVWHDFIVPVFTTTITTIWAFLPLLLSSGIIGEFIKSIPVVVSTALMGSFFVSIFITLPLIIILLKPNLPKRVRILLNALVGLSVTGVFFFLIPKNNNLVLIQILAFLIFLFVLTQVFPILINRVKFHWNFGNILKNGLISFEGINKKYKRMIEKILISGQNRRKTVFMVIIFSLFCFALLPLGFVKNEFFPKENAPSLYLTLEMPSGTNLSITEQESKKILEKVSHLTSLEFATADIGKGFDPSQGPAGAGNDSVLFTLRLVEKGKRKASSGDLAEELRREFAGYDKGKLSVQEVSGGPPAGADLQIKLLGNDLNTLDSYANKVEDYLKSQKGVTNVSKSIKPGTSKLTFLPNKETLAQYQIGVEQLGLFLRAYASGLSVDKNKFEGDTNTDITLRFNSISSSVDSISSLIITTPTGNLPLASLGQIKLEPNPTLITREDGKRTISVSAAVTKGFNVASLNRDLENFANTKLNLPQGYTWKTGGVNEENQKSVQSILQAMLLSFFLIIVTMVIQFSSFRRAIIVMLVIPLSISGVFLIFALTQTPLSFPALIGVLALFGIVVKNSILVVDKIIRNQKRGMKFIQSISEASASRLEPIALTSFCTIAGLIPITLSDPLWRGLGGAIIAGLTFSGTIMLFFIPVVYYYLLRKS